MSLLAGIKTGKKKRKDLLSAGFSKDNDNEKEVKSRIELQEHISDGQPSERVQETSSETNTNISANQSIADQLRSQLSGGGAISTAAGAAAPDRDLEDRGRIRAAVREKQNVQSTLHQQVTIASPAIYSNDADQTISEMLKAEKSQSMSLEELEARDLLRLGKKRRLKQNSKSNVDSDEEDDVLIQKQQAFLSSSQSQKAIERATSRAVAKSDLQDKMVSKLWWWIESKEFDRKRLVALGNHVSLAMAPPSQSIHHGRHFYLVPLAHVESLAAAEPEVWDELARFQTSLRALFRQQNYGLVFFETVLPSNSFWQTRLECVAIPNEQWMDAALFIKQALLEQAQDDGTHQKVMATTSTKGLPACVPKNFSYIYMEYDQQQGYVQMIESRDFPKDFAVDTIAGMIQEDPMRFRRKLKVAHEEERAVMLSFLDKWKTFDWTLQLDA
ncbi:hypothetical protein MPSEU_000837400 [Mayamaea pseudoterrestris]|nr:hypothetical protein MPSEU_000837400 [Mayamaea pseudoterrestris]